MTSPQRVHRPDSSGRRFGTKEGGARIRGPRRTDQFGTASTLRTLPLPKGDVRELVAADSCSCQLPAAESLGFRVSFSLIGETNPGLK